ncbi:MAG: polysaccharide deacetylase family protein [Betaproteobacteria bacterium]|nr:polysaccharide deacetylase family protein [Betaproteobacteria bacterium]
MNPTFEQTLRAPLRAPLARATAGLAGRLGYAGYTGRVSPRFAPPGAARASLEPQAGNNAGTSHPGSSATTCGRLCVVLHDVAPPQWDDCRRTLVMLCRLAQETRTRLRVTLLVVPGWHGNPCMPPDYLLWLQRLQSAGHELALHGLTHLDEAPRNGPLAFFERDFYFTSGEGEFAALTLAEAARRLRVAQTWARVHGLNATGFVPPAWLLNDAAWLALRKAGFDYVCTPGRIVAMPSGKEVSAHALGFSPRNAWRRAVSMAWVRAMSRFSEHHELLRLDLHPVDIRHEDLCRAWIELLERELPRRQVVLLRDAAPKG